MEDPTHLFRVTTELPFFVGALLGYILTGAISFGGSLGLILLVGPAMIVPLHLSKGLADRMILLTTVRLVQNTMIAVSIATGLIFGFWLIYLVVGALGLEVQREAIADLINNRRGWTQYLRLCKPAALVAIGFQIGIFLTPKSILVLLPTSINFDGLIVFLMTLILSATIAFLTWLWLFFARFYGRRVFGIHASTSSPQLVRRLMTLGLTALLLVLLVPAAIGEFAIEVASNADATFPQLFVTFLTSIIMVLFLYAIAFGVTWLFLRVYKLIWRPYCPSCKKIIQKRYTVGQLCEHCGQELASWLFVT